MFTVRSNITVSGKLSRYCEEKLTLELEKLRTRNWDTILESHGRLDKTVYGESSVKVSP